MNILKKGRADLLKTASKIDVTDILEVYSKEWTASQLFSWQVVTLSKLPPWPLNEWREGRSGENGEELTYHSVLPIRWKRAFPEEHSDQAEWYSGKNSLIMSLQSMKYSQSPLIQNRRMRNHRLPSSPAYPNLPVRLITQGYSWWGGKHEQSNTTPVLEFQSAQLPRKANRSEWILQSHWNWSCQLPTLEEWDKETRRTRLTGMLPPPFLCSKNNELQSSDCVVYSLPSLPWNHTFSSSYSEPPMRTRKEERGS